jgi:transposase-like protein
MAEIDNSFCPNKDCKDYRIRNRGNIKYRGKYGKDKTKDLLYCRTCGKRFASTRATAFFGLHLSDEKIGQIIHHAAEGVGVRATARLLGLDKDTVNRVILRAGEHCQLVLSSLLRSLKLKEAQLDELWAFVKKRNVLANKSLSKNMEQSGSGQPLILRQD